METQNEQVPEPETESSAEREPEGTGGREPDPRDAEIAELKRRLADAEPILKAHREAEDAKQSDLERATSRITELEQENAELHARLMRASVAEKTGLPLEVVAALAGDTEEALLKAAELVAGARRGSLGERPRTRVGAGASRGGAEPEDAADPAKLAAEIRKQMPY